MAPRDPAARLADACPQLRSSSTEPHGLVFSLAGPLHSVTFFSLSTLIISMVIAFLSTLLGKLRTVSDYEVSRPCFPLFVLPAPGATALEYPGPGHPQHHRDKGPCLPDEGVCKLSVHVACRCAGPSAGPLTLYGDLKDNHTLLLSPLTPPPPPKQ